MPTEPQLRFQVASHSLAPRPTACLLSLAGGDTSLDL